MVSEVVSHIIKRIDDLEAQHPYSEKDLKKGDRIIKKFVEPHFEAERYLGDMINVIPNGPRGPCCPVLLAATGTQDDPEKTILLALKHVGADCHGVTKDVIFFAASWNAATWIKYSKSFKKINVNCFLKIPGIQGLLQL